MNDLDAIRKRLRRGFHLIIYPTKVPIDTEGNVVDMGDVPVELHKMAKHDELDRVVGYYGINELNRLLGKDFIPMNIFDDRFKVIHWGFDEGEDAYGITDKEATSNLLKSKGLIDMREDLKEAYDIDFSGLPPNAFGIFGTYEFEEHLSQYLIRN